LETQNPKCVNCGEGHPVNYRGCIVAKELQKIKNKKAMKGKTIYIRNLKHSRNEILNNIFSFAVLLVGIT
jgi:stalled ribosome alternative rescue factor ArfA